MKLKTGQKVKLPNGLVGNIIGSNDGGIVVRYGDHEENPNNPGHLRAVLKDESFKEKELETEWIEGPDEFYRYWDQDGNQVIFNPDGSKTLLQSGVDDR